MISSPRSASSDDRPTTSTGPSGKHRGLVMLAVAILATVALRAFLVQSFVVPTGSMEPTVLPGDRVVAVKIGTVRRGDLVVFDGRLAFGDSATRTPNQAWRLLGRVASLLSLDTGEQNYLKRVIGTGGDRVSCCDAAGRLRINGRSVTEGYLPAGVSASAQPFDVRLPAGQLFVLGDNRPYSGDSRAHLGDPGGGMVPLDDVVGKVVLRYWPLDRMSALHGGALSP